MICLHQSGMVWEQQKINQLLATALMSPHHNTNFFGKMFNPPDTIKHMMICNVTRLGCIFLYQIIHWNIWRLKYLIMTLNKSLAVLFNASTCEIDDYPIYEGKGPKRNEKKRGGNYNWMRNKCYNLIYEGKGSKREKKKQNKKPGENTTGWEINAKTTKLLLNISMLDYDIT